MGDDPIYLGGKGEGEEQYDHVQKGTVWIITQWSGRQESNLLNRRPFWLRCSRFTTSAQRPKVIANHQWLVSVYFAHGITQKTVIWTLWEASSLPFNSVHRLNNSPLYKSQVSNASFLHSSFRDFLLLCRIKDEF